MLVRFGSVKTESVTMFGDVAVELIKMLGATGAVPGAISAEDIPSALQRLRQKLQTSHSTGSITSSPEKDTEDDKDRDTPVALATRAGPLIDILERSSAANAPVMWDKV